MAMKFTASKGGAVFAYEDGVSEATVRLKPEDDEAVIIAKLERVLSLLRKQQSVEPAAPLRERYPVTTPFVGVAPVQPPPLADSVAHAKANGWELYDPDELEEA